MEYRQKITLEVSGGETVKVAAKQKDKDSRTVEVTLTGGGIPLAIPVTVTARLRAIKPSGACVLNDCQIDGDHILVPLTEQLLAEVGTVRADIGLYDGAALLSTTQFVIQVRRSTIDEDAVESTREFSALTNALTAVDTGIAEAATAAENANRAAASLGIAVEDCNTAAQNANGNAALAEEKAALAQKQATAASNAAATANTAAQRAETAAEACDTFVNQEIGAVVDNDIATKVDAKVSEAVDQLAGKPNGMAKLDANGKITPMPTAEEVGAAPINHTHDMSVSMEQITGTAAITQGGTGAATAEEALSNLGAASSAHTHSAADLKSGTLPIARGGTGATTAALARFMLGLGNTTGAVPIANGGTNATTAARALTNLGAAAAKHTHTMADITDVASVASYGAAAVPNETISCQVENADGTLTCTIAGTSVTVQGTLSVTPAQVPLVLGKIPTKASPAQSVKVLVGGETPLLAQLEMTPNGELRLCWAYDLTLQRHAAEPLNLTFQVTYI